MAKINTIFTFSKDIATSLVAIVGNKQYTADSSHPNWDSILKTIREDDVDAFVNAIDIKKSFQNYTVGNVRIVGSEVYYGSTRLGGVVVERIFSFMANKLPVDPIMKFIDNLFKNPSSRAVNELYRFLEHKNLPITSEGYFRAYKGLNGDFYSVTAGNITLVSGNVRSDGRIYNGVGETIECVRHQVDDNKDNTCSYGLHAGSLEYAKGFAAGKMVIVEINPADVVSIPSDCEGQKLRTCKYKVVEEYVAPLDDTYVNTGSFNNNPMPTPNDPTPNDPEPDDTDYESDYDDHDCCGDCDDESDCSQGYCPEHGSYGRNDTSADVKPDYYEEKNCPEHGSYLVKKNDSGDNANHSCGN